MLSDQVSATSTPPASPSISDVVQILQLVLMIAIPAYIQIYHRLIVPKSKELHPAAESQLANMPLEINPLLPLVEIRTPLVRRRTIC
jgi:hypothetical protein